ncbi:MAG: hypothetical protein ACRDFB_10830 [Rhabdochlamydiaceae bacterium]
MTARPVESIPPIDDKCITNVLGGDSYCEGDHLMIPCFGGRIDMKVIDSIPN